LRKPDINEAPPERRNSALSKIFAFCLVALGTPLEAYYYWYSLTKEGAPTPVALMSACALILLLSVAVYCSKYSSKWYLLAFFVAIYSVSATSTGQGIAFVESSVGKKNAATSISYAEADIAALQRDKERVETEYERLDEQWKFNEEEITDKRLSIKSLDVVYPALTDTAEGISRKPERDSNRLQRRDLDRSVLALEKTNKTLLAQKEQRILEIESIKEKEDAKRAELASSNIEESYDIYGYYSDILSGKLPPEELLRLVRHLFLSLLLMLLSPVGVKLWESGQGGAPAVATKEKRKFFWQNKKEDKITKKEPRANSSTIILNRADLWAMLPDPAPLRAAAKAVGVSHTLLYDSAAVGALKIVGNPKKVEKKELLRFMESRKKIQEGA